MNAGQFQTVTYSCPTNRPFPMQNECNKSHDESAVRCSLRFPPAKLFISGIFVVFGGGFNFGFQISLINPMAEPLQQFLMRALKSRHDIEFSELSLRIFWSFVAGILFIGAIIGATITPPVVNRIGSRWSFILVGILMMIGILLSPASQYTNTVELFILSRFIVGIFIGMGTTVQGVFLTEISPADCRGQMGTLTGLFTNIGFVIASAVGLPQIFGTDTLWVNVYYLELIPCLMLVIYAIFILQESPLYFLQRMDEKRALRAVKFYHRKADNPDQVIEELQMQLQAQSDLQDVGWIRFWTDGATQRALSFSVLLNATVSFSGVMAISFFGTFLLGAIGFTTRNAALANCLASLSGTVGVLVGTVTIDHIGRRILLVGSLASLTVINICLMILVWIFLQFNCIWLGYCFLFLLIVFLFVFSVGIGPVAWFISTELVGAKFRAQVQSISISVQYLTCFICPILYSFLEKLIGPFSFLLFIIPLACTTSYIYCYLPETKNRNAEEIRHLLEVGKKQ